jgi:hypothetical protein
MEDKTPSSPDVKPDTAKAVGVTTAPDTKVETNDNIPRARLNEEIAKRKESEAKLIEYQKAEEAETQKKLEAEGEYKTVIADKDAKIKTLQADSDELADWKKTMREEELSKMSPEDKEAFGHLPLADLRKVNKRFGSQEEKVSVNKSRPSARDYSVQDVDGFANDTKGLSPKQRQGKWAEFLKSKT